MAVDRQPRFRGYGLTRDPDKVCHRIGRYRKFFGMVLHRAAVPGASSIDGLVNDALGADHETDGIVQEAYA